MEILHQVALFKARAERLAAEAAPRPIIMPVEIELRKIETQETWAMPLATRYLVGWTSDYLEEEIPHEISISQEYGPRLILTHQQMQNLQSDDLKSAEIVNIMKAYRKLLQQAGRADKNVEAMIVEHEA